MTVKDLFLDFVSYDTASDDTTGTTPSTPKQKILGQHLVEVMKSIGITDAFMDDFGYVYGSIPATTKSNKTVGYIAHMDTYGGISGKNVKPRVIKNYDGGIIKLNETYSMGPDSFPHLAAQKGKTLIVTDGTTLLGADDKAGIAEILAAAKEIIDENIPHGEIKIAFTPDEEIGEGANHFNVESFACDYAYTSDGGILGEIEYENFNGATGNIVVTGKSIHTGSAKNKLVNSMLLAMEFNALLPCEQRPEHTENYEGFFHLDRISGNVEETKMVYIIRDHDKNLFENKKQLFLNCAEFINKKYGENFVTATVTDSYYNMKEKVEPHMEIIENLKNVMIENGVEPIVTAIRGGTDGARLSYMGIPCPNICTGGANYHGRFEYAVLEDMEKSKDIVKSLMKIIQ